MVVSAAAVDRGCGGAMKVKAAGGEVSRRHRSPNTPDSVLLNEKEVVVTSPGSKVPVVCVARREGPRETCFIICINQYFRFALK